MCIYNLPKSIITHNALGININTKMVKIFISTYHIVNNCKIVIKGGI